MMTIISSIGMRLLRWFPCLALARIALEVSVKYPSNHGFGMADCFWWCAGCLISIALLILLTHRPPLPQIVVSLLVFLGLWAADRFNVMTTYQQWIERGQPKWGRVKCAADIDNVGVFIKQECTYELDGKFVSIWAVHNKLPVDVKLRTMGYDEIAQFWELDLLGTRIPIAASHDKCRDCNAFLAESNKNYIMEVSANADTIQQGLRIEYWTDSFSKELELPFKNSR